MANRARSIPELSLLTTPANNDLMLVVDVSAADAAKKTTVSAILSGVATANLIMSNSAVLSANTLIVRNTLTPANSTAVSLVAGTLFYDNDYLYIAVSNSSIKRVSLTEF